MLFGRLFVNLHDHYTYEMKTNSLLTPNRARFTCVFFQRILELKVYGIHFGNLTNWFAIIKLSNIQVSGKNQ